MSTPVSNGPKENEGHLHLHSGPYEMHGGKGLMVTFELNFSNFLYVSSHLEDCCLTYWYEHLDEVVVIS